MKITDEVRIAGLRFLLRHADRCHIDEVRGAEKELKVLKSRKRRKVKVKV
jgi:hypothetical protein